MTYFNVNHLRSCCLCLHPALGKPYGIQNCRSLQRRKSVEFDDDDDDDAELDLAVNACALLRQHIKQNNAKHR